MKTRAEVVGLPEIVTMRRGVQAAYARLGELRKAQHGQSGSPGASLDTIGRTSKEIGEATAEHERLSRAYEVLVVKTMRGTPKITVVLSSYNMGEVDEVDFDLWRDFVSTRIDDAFGVNATVEQHGFGDASDDEVIAGPEVDADDIRSWLKTLAWEAFCGEAWTAMRAAHDAAMVVEEAGSAATDAQISEAARTEEVSIRALGATDQGAIEEDVREHVAELIGDREGTLVIDEHGWTWTSGPLNRRLRALATDGGAEWADNQAASMSLAQIVSQPGWAGTDEQAAEFLTSFYEYLPSKAMEATEMERTSMVPLLQEAAKVRWAERVARAALLVPAEAELAEVTRIVEADPRYERGVEGSFLRVARDLCGHDTGELAEAVGGVVRVPVVGNPRWFSRVFDPKAVGAVVARLKDARRVPAGERWVEEHARLVKQGGMLPKIAVKALLDGELYSVDTGSAGLDCVVDAESEEDALELVGDNAGMAMTAEDLRAKFDPWSAKLVKVGGAS